MNKYCKSKWDRTRPAYTIRERKYKRIEVLNTSNSVSSVSGKESKK